MSDSSSVDPTLPPSQTALNNNKDEYQRSRPLPFTIANFRRALEEALRRWDSQPKRSHQSRPHSNIFPYHENSSNYSSSQEYDGNDDDDEDTVTTNTSTNEEVEEAFKFIISNLDSNHSPLNHFIADTLEGMLTLWSSQYNQHNHKQKAKNGMKETSTETTQAKIYKRDLQSDEERRQMQILNQNKQILAALQSSQPNIRWRSAKDHTGAI